MAICSGFIILFFIHAFEVDLTVLEYFKRWFIGILVAAINIVFSGLFYSKWRELKQQTDLNERVIQLEMVASTQTQELAKIKVELSKSKSDFDQLFTYTEELEAFKVKETQKLTCPYCHMVHENVYYLNSHKGHCTANPKKGKKSTIFEEF
jgi:hypothetical protein